MKLFCTVAINNRLVSTRSKPVKSTLAICKHPRTSTYYILLFTAQIKTGTRYDIKDNVSQVFTRCLNEGKATIQFKHPQHDLMIQSEIPPLRCFVQLLKRVLAENISANEVTYSTTSVMPFDMKNLQTKMCIRKWSDYPVKGFPRVLEILHINDIQRSSLDRGILNLPRLKVLDLGYNCIQSLPMELSKLPSLVEVNMEHNMLGKSKPNQWIWIGGKLADNLKVLNLSSNNLRYLPIELVKLHKLITLRVDDNKIKSLPSGIGNLCNLQTFTASKNSLSSLPGCVSKWKLEYLDLSDNKFRPDDVPEPEIPTAKIPTLRTLKESAARAVLAGQFSYNASTLPLTVVKFLDHAKYCVCGMACFDTFLMTKSTQLLSMLSNEVKMTAGDSMRVPVDYYFCSSKCLHGHKDMRGRFTRCLNAFYFMQKMYYFQSFLLLNQLM